jgi:hypothetical protein
VLGEMWMGSGLVRSSAKAAHASPTSRMRASTTTWRGDSVHSGPFRRSGKAGDGVQPPLTSSGSGGWLAARSRDRACWRASGSGGGGRRESFTPEKVRAFPPAAGANSQAVDNRRAPAWASNPRSGEPRQPPRLHQAGDAGARAPGGGGSQRRVSDAGASEGASVGEHPRPGEPRQPPRLHQAGDAGARAPGRVGASAV